LFTCFQKTAGQAPATAGAKSVFEQKYFTGSIEDDRAGSDGETRVHQSHAPATQARRQTMPNFTDEILKTSHG
jgi:hypothetical protein